MTTLLITFVMYEPITYPYRPHPDQVFRPAGRPTIAKWAEHRARRTTVAERGGQMRFQPPWRGERQVGTARSLYATTTRQTHLNLAKLPAHARTRMPRSGAYPVVRGVEAGTGPNVLIPSPPVRLSRGGRWLQQQQQQQPLRPGRHAPERDPLMLTHVPSERDVANIIVGPAAPLVQPLYGGNVLDQALADAGMDVGAQLGAEGGQALGQAVVDRAPALLGAVVGGLKGAVQGGLAGASLGPWGAAGGALSGAGLGAYEGYTAGEKVGRAIKPVTQRVAPVAGRAIGRRLGAHAGRAIAVGA